MYYSYQQYIGRSHAELLLFTRHASAVRHVTGIENTASARAHGSFNFGQNFCYIRKEYYLFYQKSAGSHMMLFVKFS